MSEEVIETNDDPAEESVEEQPVVENAPPKRTRNPRIRNSEEYMMELRRENTKLRKTLEEQSAQKAEEIAEQRLAQLREETQQKAEEKAQQLLEKKLKELEDQNRSRLIRAELKAHAMKAGVIDFDDLFQVMGKDLEKVELSDSGEVINAAELIADLKQRKSHFFAGVNTASTQPTPKVQQTVEEKPVTKLSEEEYRQQKSAFLRSLRGT